MELDEKCVGEENNMKLRLAPIAKSWEATFVFSIEVVFFFRYRSKQVMIGSEYLLCIMKISFRDAYLEVLR
jgi:hypothetical protein